MQTEVLVAMVATMVIIIATSIIHYLGNRRHARVKPKEHPSEQKLLRHLKEKRNMAFNAKEEVYHDLTRSVAKYVLNEKDEDKKEIERLMGECDSKQEEYELLNQEFVDNFYSSEHLNE